MAIAAAVAMLMGMLVGVTVFVGMIMVMRMTVAVISFTTVRQMHIKLYSINRAFLPAIGTECIAIELELFELRFQRIKVHPQIDHCTQKHVATNATENIEVKGLHVAQNNHICPSLDEPNILQALSI